MEVNYCGIKFEKSLPSIRKRKKIVVLCSRQYPIKLKLGRFTSYSCSDTKQTNKQTKRALSFSFCKPEPIAFTVLDAVR